MVKNVKILKTPVCSSCSHAAKLIKKIKDAEELLFEIEEFDITENPELLQKYPMMVSPGIVIDGKLEFAGMPSEKKLKKKLI